METLTFQTPDEARAWDMYVAAFGAVCNTTNWIELSAGFADAMILERRKRTAGSPAPAPVQVWIEHKAGDPMPCDGETMVVYKLTDGLERKTKAGRLNWLHVTEASRIVAWRPA